MKCHRHTNITSCSSKHISIRGMPAYDRHTYTSGVFEYRKRDITANSQNIIYKNWEDCHYSITQTSDIK